MFLKEKRDTTAKVQMCTHGRGQCGNWSKQDTTLPTVLIESVFITTVVDAHDGCDVVCFDITGALLHADSDEDITMTLKGRLAELMVQVPSNMCRKYITVDRQGKAILYVKMQKAIHGLLRSAHLFYMQLVADLESIGFVLNPYDPCVANQFVNRNQMTVCLHINDLKLLHKDPEKITKSCNWPARPMECLSPPAKVKCTITLE
jgi:hypothetical protein